jgi:hypothetical protein
MYLLHPVTPIFHCENCESCSRVQPPKPAFEGLDWEIEDLCSEALLLSFESDYPWAVASRQTVGAFIHRALDSKAKPLLKAYFLQHATIEDARTMLELLKALRSYVGLDHDFIV